MYELFFILGLTIFAGLLATAVFDRTRISQVILLMAFGFILGPLLNIVDSSEGSIMVSVLPFIATLALIVLLFDAGLMIDIFSVARAITKGTIFTILVFTLSVILTTAFCIFILNWPLLNGVLLGAVVGGTSSAIVIAMADKTETLKETKSLLTLESTITDALCIIVAVIVIQLIHSNQAPEAGAVVNLLLSSFLLAAVFGIISAILWIFAMHKFYVSKYAYMITLGLVFGVYAITEAVKANGGFAVFAFGLVLSNAKEVGRLLRMDANLTVTPNIRLFQEEITFFVRTFFFVYMGLLLSPSYFSLPIIGIAAVLVILFLTSRWVGQKIVLQKLPETDQKIVAVLLPRGLAAAVLATLPFSNGIKISGFQEIAFGVILLSNIVATVGLYLYDKRHPEDPLPDGEEPEKPANAPGTEGKK